MAAGLPVLLAGEVGLAREVEQANAGIIVPATPEGAGMAWQKLLAEPGLREAMGKRGMMLAGEKFAADVVAAKMLEMLTSVSGRG
jgi:glycosyltransferase involved in cell wall biosynthesis